LNGNTLQSKRTTDRDALAAQLRPETANADRRSVNIIWFTGADVARNSAFEGAYTLRFDPKGADLSLLNSGAAVLDNHDSDKGVAGQLGVIDRAWKDGTNYLATIRFSKRPSVDGLWQDIQDGIVRKFSMGVEILAMSDQRDKGGQLIMRTATRWRPYELSVVSCPADFGTTTLRGADAARRAMCGRIAALARQREIDIIRLR
jgi:phage head maturation protease